MPTWFIPLLDRVAKIGGPCFAGLFLLAAAGWYYSTATFALAGDLQAQGEKFNDGIGLILIRLDVSDAEGKLREVGSNIRTKQNQLADMTTILDGMDLTSQASVILRENIRELNAEINDLIRQRDGDEAALRTAKQSLTRAVAGSAP